jgi:hypothetical protein
LLVVYSVLFEVIVLKGRGRVYASDAKGRQNLVQWRTPRLG